MIKQIFTASLLLIGNIALGQDIQFSNNFESLEPITWKKVMTLDGYQRDHIKALNRSNKTSLYNADTNEFNFRIGPLSIDYKGAGVERRVPLLFKESMYIDGILEYNKDGYRYRVSITNIEHISWLNNTVTYDPSVYIKVPRNEKNRNDYFKSVDYTLTKFFQSFDITETDDEW